MTDETPNRVLIRPAEAGDAEAVWTIFREVVASGDTYAFAPDTRREEALRLWMEAPLATYVAERDGAVVGTYYLKINQPGPGAHVCNAGFMVPARERGRGIGCLMARHALEEAPRLGFTAMQFNLVVATNTGAIALWESLGFTIVGTLPKAFRHARFGFVDAHVMYREL